MFGIQSVLGKHEENQVTITLLGIVAILSLCDLKSKPPPPRQAPEAPGHKNYHKSFLCARQPG